VSKEFKSIERKAVFSLTTGTILEIAWQDWKEKSLQTSVRFEPSSSRIHVKSVTAWANLHTLNLWIMRQESLTGAFCGNCYGRVHHRVVLSFKAVVPTYQSVRSHNPEDHSVNPHHPIISHHICSTDVCTRTCTHTHTHTHTHYGSVVCQNDSRVWNKP
jgi:hypothetical protein